jgi:hypothetical protein
MKRIIVLSGAANKRVSFAFIFGCEKPCGFFICLSCHANAAYKESKGKSLQYFK